MLAKLGAEAAFAAQAAQVAGAGAGDDEPVAFDGLALQRAGVLEQERSLTVIDAAGHSFEIHVTQTFSGDIEGEGVVRFLQAVRTDESSVRELLSLPSIADTIARHLLADELNDETSDKI